MNKVDQIKSILELEEEKENLEGKLSLINEKIKKIKNDCSHVSVNLGYYGVYPSTGDEYCCLLCGMGKNREFYYDTRYMVHAENFMPKYDIKDDKQCIEKFENIQILALGILKENPDMSNEELVSRLNTLIESDNSKSNNGPRLIKKKNSKK